MPQEEEGHGGGPGATSGGRRHQGGSCYSKRRWGTFLLMVQIIASSCVGGHIFLNEERATVQLGDADDHDDT